MAVNYVNRKCESCGSRKFEYNEKSRTWTCLYCGSTTEREEKYEGLFTIKNVVRQTLLDVSYRRLESAEKNLTECEKIDSKYEGTIIANLCYHMVMATTPGAADSQDIKAIIAKIKKYNDNLQSEYSIITDDEEVLYEFFESSDIYATLLLVFDSVNDSKRSEYVRKILKLEEVESKETIKSLLGYSIKNQNYQMFDELIRNRSTDKRFALTEVLEKYPDNARKVENTCMLFGQGAFSAEDKGIVEKYFSESDDSILTKSRVFEASTASGVKTGTEVVIQYLLEKADTDEIVKSIFTQMCSSRLSDEDVNRITGYCLSCRNTGAGVIGLTALKDSSQYVVLEQKHIVSLLSRSDAAVEEKMRILKKAYEFNIDARQRDAVVNSYLCFNRDKTEDRQTILPFLLDTVKTIPTNTFENYIQNCNIDGTYKADVVKKVFQLDINISFYHDLLAKYMPCTVDSIEVKNKIITLLIEKGIKLDPKSFSQYVCDSSDDPSARITFVKMLRNNGCQLKSDTLNSYLTGISGNEQFNPDLFALLLDDAHVLTDEAMKNYLLFCRDRDSAKVKNAEMLSKKLSGPFGSAMCSINHLDSTINCNLLQAYILCTPDTFEVSCEIVRMMLACKVKINAEMNISSKGTNEKLKKYVLARRGQLGYVTDKLCETNKVYSMLF